jgi:hypothetical protein
MIEDALKEQVERNVHKHCAPVKRIDENVLGENEE